MGWDKRQLMMGGETLLERTVRVMREVADEVVVVGGPDLSTEHLDEQPVPDQVRGGASDATPATGDEEGGQGRSHRSLHRPPLVAHKLPTGSVVISDDVPGAGPLGGLLSGLKRTRKPWVVAVACDLPFLDPAVLRYLLGLAPGHAAVVPHVGGRDQPLHAVYSRAVLATVERHVAAGQLRLGHLVADLQVRRVEESELRPLDPELQSFLNVNTPADWDEALRRGKDLGSGQSWPRP